MAQHGKSDKKIAEGVTPEGKCIELWEIEDSHPIRGRSKKWQVIDSETQEAIDAAGAIFLDEPRANDAALADMRNQVYQVFMQMTNSNMRDLRANFGGGMDQEAEKQRRIALVQQSVLGLRLTASQMSIVDSILENVMQYDEDFLQSTGEIVKHPWDPGSCWELVEGQDGEARLVRQSLDIDDGLEAEDKHTYKCGQKLQVQMSVMPEDVIIRECVGATRYRVQSEMTGRVFDVEEADLCDTSEDSGLFDGSYPMSLGDVANLF